MKQKFITLFLLGILLTVASFSFGKVKEDTRNIRYYYLGSYRALVGVPEGRGPFPVVIYSYDEFYDWAGPILSNKQGYNFKDIVSYFMDQGFVCVIPLSRFRRVDSIVGVAHYLEKKAFVDPNNIHLVGMSEGAFLNYVATYKYPKFKSMVAICPIQINDKGYLSGTHNYLKPTNPKLPVLFIMVRDLGWRINAQNKVYNIFKSKYKYVTLRTYYKEKRWFWDLNNLYGKDVNLFLKFHYNPVYGKSSNTYKSP